MSMRVDTSELQSIADRLKSDSGLRASFDPHFKQASLNIHQFCVDEAPIRTGQLQKSIDLKFTGLSAEIGADDSICPYSKFVYGGTMAHKVVPVSKKALSWAGGFGVAFSRGHVIPAIPPNPFLLKSYEKHKPQFISDIEAGFAEVIEGNK